MKKTIPVLAFVCLLSPLVFSAAASIQSDAFRYRAGLRNSSGSRRLAASQLQMVLDSLPFLLMQVDARVLALYYIAYATNGFFQHCNIRLRYGVLNYIVGSAETHRWHHSRIPRESNANYGNTIIIWDLLFGTWYLPRERESTELGLQDAAYPKSFLMLMRAPFRR